MKNLSIDTDTSGASDESEHYSAYGQFPDANVSLISIEAEIKELAKKFCHNQRVARKYHKDKEKIISFLKLLGEIATSEIKRQSPPHEENTQPIEFCTFTRTRTELCDQSGLTGFEVDKYLRWATKGLEILQCEIPKDKKTVDREITVDCRAISDLQVLLDPSKRVGLWDLPVHVAENEFKFKSLSAFALNIVIGCMFGCHFCYVPSASTIFLSWRLLRFGILDADGEWGTYCLIRKWDEDHFRNSLKKILAIPESELPADGHRAIMMCTNTDAYQPVFHPDPVIRIKLHQYLRTMVRRILEILLEPEFEPLKLRLQTRGLQVENDFDLLSQFGNRLLFGMSIPTLDNTLAKIYEPKAPAPTRRLELTEKAIAAGINCYTAMAPTYPECDEDDIRKTLTAFSTLPLWTIFHESVNARANNVDRIEEEAARRKLTTKAGIIRNKSTRIPYAINQMQLVEKVATELGITHKLHLWPDSELLNDKVINAQPDPEAFRASLRNAHGRISEWPGKGGPGSYDPYKAAPADEASTLTAPEKKELTKAIAIVRRVSKSQYDAGKALDTIVTQRLYRPSDFGQFCQATFGFSRQHGYNLIDFAKFTESLTTVVDKKLLPPNERLCRPVIKAFRKSEEQRQAAWVKACEIAGGIPSPEQVTSAIQDLSGKPHKHSSRLNKPNPKATKLFRLIDEIDGVFENGTDTPRLRVLFNEVKTALHAIFPTTDSESPAGGEISLIEESEFTSLTGNGGKS